MLYELDYDQCSYLYAEAEAEAIQFIDQQIIPRFYASRLGVKLLTNNSLFESYVLGRNLMDIDQF